MTMDCRRALEASVAQGSSAASAELVEHLEGCPDCAAQVWMRRNTANAAERSAEQLSPAATERVWARLRDRRESPARARPRWPIWVGAFGLAGAAAAALVLVLVPSTTTGWLSTPAGVRAWAGSAEVSVQSARSGPRLTVERGTVAVEFDRSLASGPLSVITPHGDVLVHGTVFFVDVKATHTAVGVQRGVVEVRSQGRSARVRRGRQISLGRDDPQPRATSMSKAALMQSLFGAPPAQLAEVQSAEVEPKPVVDDVEPYVEPTYDAPDAVRKNRRLRARKKHRSRPDRERAGSTGPSVATARAALRAEGPSAALELVDEMLARPDLSRDQREEALYLRATILRQQNRSREAADTLEQLAAGSRSHKARLARLDLARLALDELGEPKRARRAFEDLLTDGRRDTLAEQARFELCSLLIGRKQFRSARTCLERYAEAFPASPRIGEARQLERRLRELGAEP